MESHNPSHLDVYQIITDRIINQLEQSIVPWKQTWTESGPPCNLLTKRPYHGINVLLLINQLYPTNYYLSWKQLKAVGGSVHKGETGYEVIFWKRIPENGTNNNEQKAGTPPQEQQYKYLLRYYKVFNIAQCHHIPEHVIPKVIEYEYSPISACDEIIEKMPKCPKIKHTKQLAFYDPKKDFVNMPRQGSFESIDSYYSTLFHELIHSTGHQNRLNRKEIAESTTYGSDLYSMEELTAEIGTTFLQSFTGLKGVFDNSISYINGWLEVLRKDKKLIIQASSQAQKAVDYMLNVPSTVPAAHEEENN